MRGLYVHIPFCARKCPYCAFYSDTRLQLIDDFISALLKEAKQFEGMEFSTVYMGGGTPSVLRPEQFERLIAGLSKTFDLSAVEEFTVEINPESCSRALLTTMKNTGVNRLSIGFQSLSQEELGVLGRSHTVEQSLECLENANSSGFSNVNVDLIFAFKGQTLDSWRATLEQASALPITHISTYSLTPKGPVQELDEETVVEMFKIRDQILEPKGFIRYEISNYARNGRVSKHNLIYWQHQAYLGLGPSASSFEGNTRWTNEPDLLEYIKQPGRLRVHERLEADQLQVEKLFLALRLSRGVDLRLPEIPEHLEGYVEKTQSGLRLTPEGVLVADRVVLELWELLEEQQG